VNQGHDEVPEDCEIEFGTAMQPWLKVQRNFSHLQAPAADGQEFVEEFEAVDVHLTHQRQAALQAQHDEAAHAIAQVPVGPGQAPTGKTVGEGGSTGASITEASYYGEIEEAAPGH